MDASLIHILSGYGDSTIKQIRQHLEATGTNATGKTSKSLRFEVKQDGDKVSLKIFGKPYIAVVETGRKATPSYKKPSKEFVASIKEWVKARGIKENAAYGIALSIHQKGTKLHAKGGRQDIISNVINQGLVDEISNSVLRNYANILSVNIKEIYGRNSN